MRYLLVPLCICMFFAVNVNADEAPANVSETVQTEEQPETSPEEAQVDGKSEPTAEKESKSSLSSKAGQRIGWHANAWTPTPRRKVRGQSNKKFGKYVFRLF